MLMRHWLAHHLHHLANLIEPEPPHVNEGILDNGTNDTTGFFIWNGATYIGRTNNGGPNQ